jgi:hypothetical protein
MVRRALLLLAASLAAACGGSSSDTPPHKPTGTAAPVILVPANHAYLGLADVTAGQVTFSGTATAGATVDVEIASTSVCSVVAAGNGTWTCSGAVAEGAKQVRAKATLASTGTSPLSVAVNFTLDLTRPTPPAISTAPVTTNVIAFNVAGTAEANAVVRLLLDGAFVASVAAGGNGAFQGIVTLPNADGPVGITAIAVDAARNASDPSAVTTITVDRTPPAPATISAPTAGAHLGAADLVAGELAVSGTAPAGVTVEVLMDGVHLATVTAAGDGSWSANAPLAASKRYTAAARTVDAIGNASATASVSFALSVARLAAVVAPPPRPLTTWAQSVPDATQASNSEVFPGQANTWVVDADFSLAQGWGGQFSHALQLRTGDAGASPTQASLATLWATPTLAAFPNDQNVSEVTFLSPRFTTADGVRTAAVSDGVTMGVPPLDGTRSAYLNGTSDSRLARTLTFDPGLVYTISWSHDALLASRWTGGLLGADAAPFGPQYQVVLRDPANQLAQIGDPLFVSTFDVKGTESVSISGDLVRAAAPSGVAVLSFELRAEPPSYVEIDLVAVVNDAGPVALTNPDFESGLDPWVANGGAESQNVRSGPRTVDALQVTRTVYAAPSEPWARVVDVFENPSLVTTVSTSAVYSTLLAGVEPFAMTTTVGGSRVVAWDGSQVARDVGFVFGNGAAYVSTVDPQIFVVHDLVVAPGAKVALVHFVVQLGEFAGGPTAADVPVNTDAVCVQIANGFPASDVYWQDLEPGVMQVLQNF